MRTAQLDYRNAAENWAWCVEVPAKTEELDWQKRGLSYTATGYGARIPTSVMVRFKGKWRRVYCRIYSNSGTCFIGKWSDNISVSGVYV